MFQKLIVCIDESPQSEQVVRASADLACRYNAQIVLLSVLDPARFADQPYSGLEAIGLVDRHSRSLTSSGHRLKAVLDEKEVRSRLMILPGKSAETILEVARNEKADLIIVGTEAKGRLRAWLENDLWSELSHKAPCNVLRISANGKAESWATVPAPMPTPSRRAANQTNQGWATASVSAPDPLGHR